MVSDTPPRVSCCYDVIVVGSGVMGSATALAAARRGSSVLLLEQYDAQHRRGSSGGESRIIRRSYSDPHFADLVRRSYDMWDSLADEANTQLYTTTGGEVEAPV